ncbi:MAG TPA: hypothetical protein VNO14_07980 [Blastocatellia bacterium]|nr:hypothetical protein [Blastocatellia bacterium]
MRRNLKALWGGWKRFANVPGRFQTRLLLTLTYFLVAGPTWLLMSIAGKNPLKSQFAGRAEYWTSCESAEDPIEGARRRF